MTISMLLTVVAFPFVLPLIISAVLWRKLNRRWLFLVVSFLCVVGLNYLVFDVMQYTLEPPPVTADNVVTSIEAFARNRQVVVLIADGIVLVAGLPLLYWLFLALRFRNAADR